MTAAILLTFSSCDAKSVEVSPHATKFNAEERFDKECFGLREEWILKNVTIILRPNSVNERSIFVDMATITTNSRGNIQLVFLVKSENKIYYIQNEDFCITNN